MIVYLIMHCCKNATHMMSNEAAKKRRNQRRLTEGDYFRGGGGAFQDDVYLDDGLEEDYMTFTSSSSLVNNPNSHIHAQSPSTRDETDLDIHQPRSFMG